MPQINQLPDVFASQLFWLAIFFGLIFFAIGIRMLPKIRSTVDERDRKVSDDLEKAKAARAAAEESENEWRIRIDNARQQATRAAQEAKRQSAIETEARVKEALDEIDAKVEAARVRLWTSVQAARAEMEAVVAEATQQMVQQLTGLKVDRKVAADAVAVELENQRRTRPPGPSARSKNQSQPAALGTE